MGALGKGYTYGILISCFIKEDEERRGEKGEGGEQKDTSISKQLDTSDR